LLLPAAEVSPQKNLLGLSSYKRWRPFPELGLIKTTFVSGVTLLRFVDDADEFLKRVDIPNGALSSSTNVPREPGRRSVQTGNA
jgi:hypothetical protein